MSDKNIITKPLKSGWFRYTPDSRTVFIFVHGFFSDAEKCWRSKSGTSWPELVRDDPRLDSTCVYIAEYHTGISAGDYGIADSARSIRDDLLRPDIDGLRNPLDLTQLIFVCHSMGGLVVRYLLESERELFSYKEIGILLVASPSIGSDYASSFSMIARLFKNRQAKELKKFSALLMDLDGRFKNLIHNIDRNYTLWGAEAVENHGPLFFRKIVGRESAGRYFGAPTIIPNCSHSSIVKPTDGTSPVHRFLIDHAAKHLDLARVAINQESQKTLFPADGDLTLSDVLFDIYLPRSEPFFLAREIDARLKDIVRLQSVWIFGPSGVGKTSTVRRLLSHSAHRPVEICLANTGEIAREIDVVSEIAETIAQVNGCELPSQQSALNWLVTELVRRSQISSVTLYIDEIPYGTDGALMRNVVNVIAGLLTRVTAAGGHSVRFIVSSISQPELNGLDNPGQFRERMRIIIAHEWENEDLRQLFYLIYPHLSLPPYSDADVEGLVAAANGSPRFVKSVLRYQIGNPGRDILTSVSLIRSENQQ